MWWFTTSEVQPLFFRVGAGRVKWAGGDLNSHSVKERGPKPRVSTNFTTCPVVVYVVETCPPSRTRTYDRSLKRRLLYQLSYGRIQGTLIPYFCVPKKYRAFMCREWDSNPHGRNAPEILSLLCLPFHHPGMISRRPGRIGVKFLNSKTR